MDEYANVRWKRGVFSHNTQTRPVIARCVRVSSVSEAKYAYAAKTPLHKPILKTSNVLTVHCFSSDLALNPRVCVWEGKHCKQLQAKPGCA